MGSKPSVIAEMCQESLLQMGGVRGILLHFEGDEERKNQDRKRVTGEGQSTRKISPHKNLHTN